tara:strand:- start:712 stop:1050 length:339 start_codon:yes stop_codon:yes gene_type:complete
MFTVFHFGLGVCLGFSFKLFSVGSRMRWKLNMSAGHGQHGNSNCLFLSLGSAASFLGTFNSSEGKADTRLVTNEFFKVRLDQHTECANETRLDTQAFQAIHAQHYLTIEAGV